jgi:branched-chain amino acid transport system ATP-binding protein
MSVSSKLRGMLDGGADHVRTAGALVLDGVSAGYGNRPVLRQVDLRVERGEAVALLGANGAGKTTLLRTISGMVRLETGSITYAGAPIGGLPPRMVLGMGIAHVPQGRQVFAEQTVAENLLLGARLRRDPEQVAADRAYVLDVFPALAEKLHQKAGELSGGQQQALAIARSLMANPTLLMLDEPSIGLAPKLVDNLAELLRTLRRDRDMGILIVEQDALLALESTDRAYVMQRGEISLERESSTLIGDSSVTLTYLGGEPNLDADRV